MKLGKIVARHGDLTIRKIDEIPENAKKNGLVLAEGETTGHKHKLLSGQSYLLEKPEEFDNGQLKVLKVFEVTETETQLVHEEHKPVTIRRGKYAVINEREYNPFAEAIQQVTD